MFDRFVAIGAEFDWITPVLTWLMDLRSGGSVGYNVPVDAGWSALAIQMMLHDAGVRIWGLSIVAGIITFRLKQKQARYAQYLLERHGIPYEGGLDVPKSRYPQERQTEPARAGRERSYTARMVTPFDRVIERIQRL